MGSQEEGIDRRIGVSGGLRSDFRYGNETRNAEHPFTGGFLMGWQERIVVDPAILTGKPAIKGTRLAVEFLLELLAEGWTREEILRNYPRLTDEDLQAVLHHAGEAR